VCVSSWGVKICSLTTKESSYGIYCRAPTPAAAAAAAANERVFSQKRTNREAYKYA